jgi:hypothetical protein
MEYVLYAADGVYTIIFMAAGVLAALHSQRDLRAARTLIIVGAIIVAARWTTWAISTESPWPVRGAVGALIGATLFVLIPSALRWLSERQKTEMGETTDTREKDIDTALNERILDPQVGEIRRVIDFLGGKNEMELREQFDFPDVFRLNVATYGNMQAACRDQSRQDSAECDIESYLPNGGDILVDARLAESAKDIINGVSQFRTSLTTIWGTVRTQKARQAISDASRFEKSALLPREILDAIKTFNLAVQANHNAMISFLNDALHESQQNFIDARSLNSAAYFSMINRYNKVFVPLEPKATTIIDVIRHYLGLN